MIKMMITTTMKIKTVIKSKFGLCLLLFVFPGLDIRSQSGNLGASKLFVQDLCPLLGFNTLYTLTIAYFWQMFSFLNHIRLDVCMDRCFRKMRWCLFKLYFHLIMYITQCLLFFNFRKIDKFTFSYIVQEVQVCFHRSSRKQLYLLHFSVSLFFLSAKSHSYSKKKVTKKKGKGS